MVSKEQKVRKKYKFGERIKVLNGSDKKLYNAVIINYDVKYTELYKFSKDYSVKKVKVLSDRIRPLEKRLSDYSFVRAYAYKVKCPIIA